MDKSFDPTPADVVTEPTHEMVQQVEEGLADLAAVFPTSDVQGLLKKLGYQRAPVRVNLEIDLSPASVTPGYATSRIDDITLNTTPQRVALKLLSATLTAHRAELLDGTRIQRPQHTIQWLLEQIAVRMPSQLLDELMEGVQ